MLGAERWGDAALAAWMAALPGTIAALAARWDLTVGAPYQPGGATAWVAPVERDGRELVLKVGRRGTEAAHEPDGLRHWAGDGAAVLHDSTTCEDTTAMLIERCRPGSTLRGEPEPEQDVVIASLLRRLWSDPSPGHPFRPLQQMCDQWADGFEAKGPGALDAGIAREGIALFRALPASAPRHVLLCTDLHADNVLAAEREPWLMIDPKPYVGDPTYDPLQHMLNCEDRLRADPLRLIARMADLCDLDRDRLRLWLFARCVQESAGWRSLVDVAQQIAPA